MAARMSTGSKSTSTSSRVKTKSDDQFMAAVVGDLAWLKHTLLEHVIGIPLDVEKNGLTCLHLAALHGRLDCIKFLIEERQCDANLASTTGWCPIQLVINKATGKRALQCFRYLLERGADYTVCNDDGTTACHRAATEGHVQCLKMLIARNVDLTQADCRGNTPLDLAKMWGNRTCARIIASNLWTKVNDEAARQMAELRKLRDEQAIYDTSSDYMNKYERELANAEIFNKWLKKRLGRTSPIDAADIEERVERRLVAERTESLRSASLRSASKESDRKSSAEGKLRKRKAKPRRGPWNFSPKIPLKEYTLNLDDDYPRDAITKMPQIKYGRKYFDGTFRNVTWPAIPDYKDSEEEEDEERAMVEFEKRKRDTLKHITLARWRINEIMDRDPTRKKRPVVFEASHIDDVETVKKFYDETTQPQIGIHMTSDTTTFAFQSCLAGIEAVKLCPRLEKFYDSRGLPIEICDSKSSH